MSHQNTQKNMLFLILMVMILTLSCTWGSNVQTNPTQPPAINTQSNAMPTLSGDPTGIIENAIQFLPTLSYRKREWVTDSQGNPPDLSQTPALVAEFTPPANAYLVFSDEEYLALNGSFYSRKPGGTWSQDDWVGIVPGAVSQSSATNLAALVTQALQTGGLTVTAAGADSVSGVPTQVFHVSGQVPFGGSPLDVAGKVWIDGEGRLVKMELDHPDGGAPMDLSLYEYDTSIQMPTP